MKIRKFPPKQRKTRNRKEKASVPFQIQGTAERENGENITEENYPELKQMSSHTGSAH